VGADLEAGGDEPSLVAALGESLPDRVSYTACGDCRASVCPSCADPYRRDAYPKSRTTAASMGLAFSPIDPRSTMAAQRGSSMDHARRRQIDAENLATAAT